MSNRQEQQRQYSLVVPVKTLSRAKSRLQGFSDVVRRDLVRAFAEDALGAALGCSRVSAVHVVTDEPTLVDLAHDLGCGVLADTGAGDLNRALRSAVTRLNGPVAAMLGDLPCLVSADLDAALGAIDGAGFVADAAGSGTTLLAVGDPATFDPRFGAGSRAAHEGSGLREVALAVPTLRRDVDTAEDLAAATLLGLGVHTRQALARAERR